jgi:hypothetical protein
MYLDFKTDESYTPNRISVRAGNNLQDLKVFLHELSKLKGDFLYRAQGTLWMVFIPLEDQIIKWSRKVPRS